MAKTAKQLRSDIVRHFVDAGYARSGIYNILTLLNNNQSIERKPGFDRLTTLSDKKKSGYIGACAWPGGWLNWKNNEKVPGEHVHTYQEAEVTSTVFRAASNDVAAAAE